MRVPFFKSIRTHLLLLVFISILPAMGIIIYSGIERRNHEMENARNNALRILQNIAHNHELTAENTRQFLTVLSRLPDVQDMNKKACSKLFGQLLGENPLFANIFAATPEGELFASALPVSTLNIKNRIYYQDILRTKDFSAGEYTVGTMSHVPVIPYAYPVLDNSNRLKLILVAGIKLASYGQIFSHANLPAGSTINVLDHKNTLMYRYPESERYLGKTDLPYIVKHMSAKPNEGVFAGVGVDGARRLFAYKGFYLRGNDKPYLFIRVGIPEELALFNVRNIFSINLILLSFAFFIALILAWFLGKVIIVRKLNMLLDVSRHLGDGDFKSRTDIKGEDELSQVAMAFDEMADKLELDEIRRKSAEEQILDNANELSAIYDNAPFIMMLVDKEWKIRKANAFSKLFTGIPEFDMTGMRCGLVLKCIHVFDVPEGCGFGPYCERCSLRSTILDTIENDNYYNQLEIGMLFSNGNENKKSTFLLSTKRLLLKGQPLALVSMQDITKRKRSEEMLQESEEKYRNIFENSIEGIFRTTVDGRFLVANPVLARMYGYETSQELIDNVVDMETQLYVHKDERQKFKQQLEKYGFIRGFQAELYRRDGGHFWVSLNARTVLDENGKILYYEGTVENITDRKNKEAEIINQREQLRALSIRLAELEEIERENIARELHDQIGQNLTVLGINLQIIQKNLDREEKSFVNERINDSNQLIEQTAERIRYLMTELRPSILDDYGISAAIRWYGDQFTTRTGIQVNIQGSEPDSKLTKSTENTLFRIVQEALTNVAKHSFATCVDIDFGTQDHLVIITIKDNGIGFDKIRMSPLAERRKGGTKLSVEKERRKWGINIMTERIIAVGGTCTVTSKPGKGTEVRVEIPV